MGVRRSIVSDRWFDNRLCRAESAAGYEHEAGPTTEWHWSFIRNLRHPIIPVR